ncbi:hypothetical protein AVDCRST_MAG82-2479, partial [uncultured Rubrobacteraceae bacterium]
CAPTVRPTSTPPMPCPRLCRSPRCHHSEVPTAVLTQKIWGR